jgi:Nucleotidyl transferase of unknown function (DUF2204)
MFDKDFIEFIELLNLNNVEYLVIGGYALSIYGYPRHTGDLDILINKTETNALNVLKVFNDFGFGSLGLSVLDFLKENSVVQIGYPPLRIDIINQIDGVNFDDCFKNKKILEVDGLIINFISYNDLILNKKATGRDKDLLDIINLEKANKLKNKL